MVGEPGARLGQESVVLMKERSQGSCTGSRKGLKAGVTLTKHDQTTGTGAREIERVDVECATI